jgi:hypothetical protein
VAEYAPAVWMDALSVGGRHIQTNLDRPVPNDNFRLLIECQTKLFELIANDSSGGK